MGTTWNNNNPMYIKYRELNNPNDVTLITKELEQGNILFVNTERIFQMHDDNIVLLKRVLSPHQRTGGKRDRNPPPSPCPDHSEGRLPV